MDRFTTKVNPPGATKVHQNPKEKMYGNGEKEKFTMDQ